MPKAYTPRKLRTYSPTDVRADFALTPDQRGDARSAIQILAGSGLSLTAAAEIALHRRRSPTKITLADAVPLFIRSRIAANCREETVRWYEDRMKPLCKDHGATLLDDLRRPILLEWLLLRTPGVRPGYLRAIRALLRWCAAQEPPMVGIDPSKGLALPAVRRDHSVAILTVDQAEALLRGAGRHLGAVALSLFAGVRPQEIAGRGKDWLPWLEINETERIVAVPAVCSKTRKRRTLEGLPPALWPWLAKVKDRGNTVGVARARQVADAGREILELDKWPVDVLRHTFATYAVAFTGDAAKVSLWLGHEGNSSLIHRHYRGLATEADAKKFFALRP